MSQDDLARLRDRAMAAFRAGRLAEMVPCCREILRHDPAHFEALQLLALAARAGGDLARAEDLLRRAVAARPEEAAAINTLGVVLAEQGKIEEAIDHYRQALALAPGYGKALGNLGNALSTGGRHDEALAALEQALDQTPESHFNLANGLRAAGQAEPALASYRQALALDADYRPALTNLAALCVEQGHYDEAEALTGRVLARDPEAPEAHNTRGGLLMAQGQVVAAGAAYARALRSRPDDAATRANLATALRAGGRTDDARAELERALALDPDHLGALTQSAEDMRDRGDWSGARARLEQAVTLAPRRIHALSALVAVLQQVCDWPAFAIRAAQLDALGPSDGDLLMPAEPPLLNLTRRDDPALNHRIQGTWSRAITRRMTGARERFDPPVRRPNDGRPLSIGYLSQDLRDHPVGHLVRGLFAAHDRARVQVQTYAYGPDDGSPYRVAAEQDSDLFRDLSGATHEAAARQIRDDGVDILVDLTGHTKNNRLEICALRPAPVQATYLGFPGGTGAAFIDYLIGDPIVSPPDHGAHFSEALALLPDCYQVNDRDQEIADTRAGRAEMGLEPDAVVFACFNQTYKIEPVMFDSWMRILEAVPASQLWLLEKTDGLAAANLRRAAATRGVDPARLVFAGRLPKSAHLARLTLADLGLDTRIYNGHTTTSDLLWAGVPVIALKGRHFASRVSTSLLNGLGLSELVTDDLPAFERLAVALAQDTDRRATLRRRLWDARIQAPLFDTRRTAGQLEAVYESMWRQDQPRVIVP